MSHDAGADPAADLVGRSVEEAGRLAEERGWRVRSHRPDDLLTINNASREEPVEVHVDGRPACRLPAGEDIHVEFEKFIRIDRLRIRETFDHFVFFDVANEIRDVDAAFVVERTRNVADAHDFRAERVTLNRRVHADFTETLDRHAGFGDLLTLGL